MSPRFRLKNFKDKKSRLSNADPDLVLWLDHEFFKFNEETIDLLKRGDVVEFKGYLNKLKVSSHSISMGNLGLSLSSEEIHFEDQYPHFQAYSISNLNKKSPDPVGVLEHERGRYHRSSTKEDKPVGEEKEQLSKEESTKTTLIQQQVLSRSEEKENKDQVEIKVQAETEVAKEATNSKTSGTKSVEDKV